MSERRGSRRTGLSLRVPAAETALAAVLGLALFTGTALPSSQDPRPRTVKIRLAEDRGIENRTEWRAAAVRLLNDCFRAFGRKFPLELVLGDVATWVPGTGRRSMVERLGELRREVPADACEIVLGIMLPERTGDPTLGIASYPHACILVKNLASREAMVYAVLHELCHVFGAMDIKERGSIMGIEGPGLAIDDFTAQAVRLNLDRSFGRGTFPLSPDARDRALSLFGRRAGSGLREPQVHLFLTLLFIEKDDLEAAARACSAAAEADPASPGLHNLLGNICLFRGDDDLAIAEYGKALEIQPREPGIHFNIGLACVQRGRLDEATAHFRAALEIDPGYAEARQALAAIALAGRDVASARSAIKPFILAARTGR